MLNLIIALNISFKCIITVNYFLGGVYGLFDGRVDQVVKSRLETNQVLKSSEVFPTVD